MARYEAPKSLQERYISKFFRLEDGVFSTVPGDLKTRLADLLFQEQSESTGDLVYPFMYAVAHMPDHVDAGWYDVENGLITLYGGDVRLTIKEDGPGRSVSVVIFELLSPGFKVTRI